MPTSLTRARIRLQSTSEETIYTCPSATQSSVNLLSLCNTSGSAVTVSVEVDILGSAGDNVTLLDDYSLAAHESYTYDGVIILIATDVLRIVVGTNSVIDSYASILEKT